MSAMKRFPVASAPSPLWRGVAEVIASIEADLSEEIARERIPVNERAVAPISKKRHGSSEGVPNDSSQAYRKTTPSST